MHQRCANGTGDLLQRRKTLGLGTQHYVLREISAAFKQKEQGAAVLASYHYSTLLVFWPAGRKCCFLTSHGNIALH